MMKDLKLLSMLNQTVKRNSFRVFILFGMIQLSFMYSLTEGKTLLFLALSMYILFLMISVELNEKLFTNNVSTLRLVYQSNRKKKILKYGCVGYCLLIQFIFLLISGITMAATSYFLKKDADLSLFVLLSLFTGTYSTIFVAARYNAHEKLYYAMQGVFLLVLIGFFVLIALFQDIQLFVCDCSILTPWHALILCFLEAAVVFTASTILYNKNHGLHH